MYVERIKRITKKTKKTPKNAVDNKIIKTNMFKLNSSLFVRFMIILELIMIFL